MTSVLSGVYRRYGLSVLGPATKTITKALKNAGVGANYSPLAYAAGGYTEFQYWYPVNKAVTIFREGAMTLLVHQQ